MNVRDETRLQIIRDVTPLLEKSIYMFCDEISKPSWINDKDNIFPRYQNPISLHFQILQAVRIVSGLNASVCLLNSGYTQETGVIVRTIEEFLSKIMFIHEAHVKGHRTTEQQRLIDEYFKYDIRSTKDIIEGNNFWVNMNKAYASFARILAEGTKNSDVYSVQRKLRALYDAYSGYVHGFYPHIMEMYEGGTERFRINGMRGTRRIKEMIKTIASCVVRTLNTLSLIAKSLQLSELEKELIDRRKKFCESEAYK